MAWIIGKTCTEDTMSNKSPFYFPPVKSRKTHRGWLSAYPARLTSNWLNGSIIYYRSMLTWNGCVLGETRVSGDWSEHYRWNISSLWNSKKVHQRRTSSTKAITRLSSQSLKLLVMTQFSLIHTSNDNSINSPLIFDTQTASTLYSFF